MTADCSRSEIGVFIKTSLGTRIALSVPLATTTALLIREVERVHFNCLPCLGEIKVQALMVKYKSFFYHLSHSAPLLCALGNHNGQCFLHARAIQKNTCSTTMPSTLGHDVSLGSASHGQPSGAGGMECSMMTALENNLEQKCHLVDLKRVYSNPVCEAVEEGNHVACDHIRDSSVNLENSASVSIGFPMLASEKMSPGENSGIVADCCSSENSSATRSVTDIIRRHYSATDTLVESQYQKVNAGQLQNCADRTPKSSGFFKLQDAGFGKLDSDGKRPDVGQRLLMASSKLGISPYGTSPIISIYRSKGRKHLGPDVLIRNAVFELSENSS